MATSDHKKPRILVLIPWYRPGYKNGGPIASVEALVDTLDDAFAFTIVTADRETGHGERYPNLPVDGHVVRAKAQIYYLESGLSGFVRLTHLLRNQPFDTLYLNDMFSRKWGLWPMLLRRLGLLAGRPVLVAPRNQLSRGALSIRKWKKLLFLKLAGVVGLWRGLAWHATSEEERAEIECRMGTRMSIWVAPVLPNLLTGGPLTDDALLDRRPLAIAFLSRIAPKKNLDKALSILAGLPFQVSFEIAGPVDDEAYWGKIRKSMAGLPAHVSVNYVGPVEPAAVRRFLGSHHAMLLPTRGENFGHVILEALAAGCPPIISDRTPWKDLREKGCGWVVPLEEDEGYRTALGELNAMTAEDLQRMRAAARAYAAAYVEDPAIRTMNLRMFQEVTGAVFRRASNPSAPMSVA